MSDATTLPRRVTINDLPTEIKERIVELCAEQDERLKQTLGQTRYTKSSVRGIGSCGRGPLDLIGLSTLIAAPYRFKTIKVSRSAWPVFAFRIAAVRAQYFTMLDIDECSKATLEGFLPLFPRFPNIKTLKVHPSATQHICGNHWYPHILGDLDTQVGYARVAFVGLLARLRSLEIQSHADLLYLDAFIGRAERVRTLVLDVTNLRSPHTAIRSIAKLSSLEELEITTSASTAIDFAAASSGNVRYPPLQSLTVRGEHLMDDFFDFAALFTGSLTTLVIEMQLAASDEPSDYAQPRELTFPALTDLRLTGCAKLILPLFYSFTADHYPALTTVYLYLNATPELDDADLVTVLQGHVESPRRHFKTLHIFDLACPFYPEEIRYLTSWAATNRVDLVHTPTRIYPETPLVVADPLRNLRNGEMAEQPLVSAVDQTMDFLVQWHGRAKQGQDGDGYSKLATMLRRAELERVAMAT
ncbi:hypothetical protein JCM11641_000250 [Rhodosporidiobolus odoratus]